MEREPQEAMELIDSMVEEDSELITLYYGQDVNSEEAAELAELVEENFHDCDVEVNYGGQPVYYYMVSVE